ncbi:MAG: response regulator transcription factor [Chloroflexi bacterium]|nr:response regulator transcription factor [Chloroflexota bacterium]
MRRRKPLVLVVDDEPRIQRLLRAVFEENDLQVSVASEGSTALELVEERPDVVVLDVIMPDMDGFEVMRRIREISPVPILLLTGRSEDRDKIRGLESGADDYLGKPFNPDELVARVKSLLRRVEMDQGLPTQPVYSVEDVTIDLNQRRVFVAGEEVSLSRTEWMLLSILVRNAGRVMLHEDLLSRTWGPEYRNDLQYLRGWISRLRRKMGNGAGRRLIRTIPGVGYTVPEM